MNKVFVLCLLVVLPFAVQAAEEKNSESFGRTAISVVVEPASEFIVRQVLSRLPEKQLKAAPQVRIANDKKALKLFCLGEQAQHPDIVVVTRQMNEQERKLCGERLAGVTQIKLGYDAVVLAAHAQNPLQSIDSKTLFLALARDVPRPDSKVPGMFIANPSRQWKSLGLKLDKPVRILGPAMATQAGRSVQQLAMEPGCRQWDWVAEMKYSQRNRKLYRAVCHQPREDGAFIAVEDAAELVSMLRKDRHAVGFMTFNDWQKHGKGLRTLPIDGLPATMKTIAAGLYPMSRSYYAYIKHGALTRVPGVAYFLNELASDEALQAGGYLHRAGMLPLSGSERKKQIIQANELTVMPWE